MGELIKPPEHIIQYALSYDDIDPEINIGCGSVAVEWINYYRSKEGMGLLTLRPYSDQMLGFYTYQFIMLIKKYEEKHID